MNKKLLDGGDTFFIDFTSWPPFDERKICNHHLVTGELLLLFYFLITDFEYTCRDTVASDDYTHKLSFKIFQEVSNKRRYDVK